MIHKQKTSMLVIPDLGEFEKDEDGWHYRPPGFIMTFGPLKTLTHAKAFAQEFMALTEKYIRERNGE